MVGFPLTAWALHHPWGDTADAVLDRLCARGSLLPAPPRSAPDAVIDALLGSLVSPCAAAGERWGATRVATVLGSAGPSTPQPLARLSGLLGEIRRRLGLRGPSYHVATRGIGGARAIASGLRLIEADLADAVLAGGVDDDQGALVLLERRGDAFVALRSAVEATSPRPPARLDEPTARRAIVGARAGAGNAPLGYVHVHADAGSEAGVSEHRVVKELCGDAPRCATHPVLGPAGAAAGAVDVLLAAASLSRGFLPADPALELEHDRALVHTFSPRGHHIALLLEARA